METRDLQEADILWPEPDHDDDHQDHCHNHGRQRWLEAPRDKQQPQGVCGEASSGGEARRRAGASAPVAIRAAGTVTRPSSWAWSFDSDDESEAFVPPHLELAARRRWSEGRRVASSVCVGQGRTLKGRDLQSVRNAVLRMTGFLEN